MKIVGPSILPLGFDTFVVQKNTSTVSYPHSIRVLIPILGIPIKGWISMHPGSSTHESESHGGLEDDCPFEGGNF